MQDKSLHENAAKHYVTGLSAKEINLLIDKLKNNQSIKKTEQSVVKHRLESGVLGSAVKPRSHRRLPVRLVTCASYSTYLGQFKVADGY